MLKNIGDCEGCGKTLAAYRLNYDPPTGRVYCDVCIVRLRADCMVGREPTSWQETATKAGFTTQRLEFARYLYLTGWVSEYPSDARHLAKIAGGEAA